MALVESAGAAYATGTTDTTTSGSFTATAGNLIVAIAGVGNGAGKAWTSLGITSTFTGSSSDANSPWFLLAQELEASGGGASIWVKDAGATPGAGTVTVTAGPTTVVDVGLIVRQFSGALTAAFQVAGAQATAGGTIDTASCTPIFTGSQLVGAYGAPVAGTVTYNAATSGYGTTSGGGGDSYGCFEAATTSTAGTAKVLGYSATKATSGIAIAEILPATAVVAAIVGSPGTVVQSTAGGAISTLGWGTGSSQTAGNLLVCWIGGTEAASATPAQPSGWSTGPQIVAADTSMTVFYKIASGGDSAPTFAGVTSVVWSAMLAEFAPSSGTISATPADQSGTHSTTTTATPNAVTAGGTDTAANELVVGGTSLSYSTAAVKTLTNTPGNGMSLAIVSNATTSTRAHYSYYWSHTASNAAADTNSLALTTTTAQGTSQVIQSFLLPSSGTTVNITAAISVSAAVAAANTEAVAVGATPSATVAVTANNHEAVALSCAISATSAVAANVGKLLPLTAAISASSALTVTTTGGVHWLWPGYEYPTLPDGIWQLIAANPPNNSPGYIVANPASGPGASVDPNYATAIANAQSAGWTVLGYIAAPNPTSATIPTLVDAWRNLYGIYEIFFDEVTGAQPGTSGNDLGLYQGFTSYVRAEAAAHSKPSFVVFNVGSVPNSGYLSPTSCDVCIVFENAESAYNVAGVPGFQTGTGIGHLIHDAASVTSMQADLLIAPTLGAAYVFVTDQGASVADYTYPPSFVVPENNAIAQSVGNFETVGISCAISASTSVAANVAPATGNTLAVSATTALAFGNAEAVALSCAISATSAVAVTEAVALSDAIAVTTALAAANTEAVAISDALSATTALAFGNGQTAALTDALSATTALAFGNSESVALTCAISVTAAMAATATGPAPSAAISATTALAFGNSEAVTLSDAISATTAVAFGNHEAVALSCAIAVTSAVTAAVTESVALTDAISATSALAANSHEAVALTDAIAVTSALAASLGQSLAITDAISATTALTANATEAVALTCAIAVTSAVTANATGPAPSSAIAVTSALAFGNAEQVALSDALSATSALSAQATESVALSCAISVTASQSANNAQRVALTEAIAVTTAASFANGESVPLTLAISVTAAQTAGNHETVALTDAISAVSSLAATYRALIEMTCAIHVTTAVTAQITRSGGITIAVTFTATPRPTTFEAYARSTTFEADERPTAFDAYERTPTFEATARPVLFTAEAP